MTSLIYVHAHMEHMMYKRWRDGDDGVVHDVFKYDAGRGGIASLLAVTSPHAWWESSDPVNDSLLVSHMLSHSHPECLSLYIPPASHVHAPRPAQQLRPIFVGLRGAGACVRVRNAYSNENRPHTAQETPAQDRNGRLNNVPSFPVTKRDGAPLFNDVQSLHGTNRQLEINLGRAARSMKTLLSFPKAFLQLCLYVSATRRFNSDMGDYN